MICYIGVSTGGKEKRSSRTNFPLDFLQPFQDAYGPGFSVQDILKAIPSSRPLFGNAAQSTPVGGQQQAPAQSPALGSPGPQGSANPTPGSGLGLTPPASSAGGPAGPPNAAPAASGGFRLSQVLPIIQESFPNAKSPNVVLGEITKALQGQGVDPNGQIGQDQLLAAINTAAVNVGAAGNQAALNALPARLQQYGELINRPPLQTGAQPAAPGIDATGGIERLGFTRPAPEYAPQEIRNAPAITAPGVGNAQVDIAPQGFKQYGEDIFKSLYEPAAREENRRGAIEDRTLQAQLAQSGLQSSGTGIGQIQTQRNERQQRIFSIAQDAASQASVRRFGAEFEQAKQNADLQQAQNLAKAGFDQAAQTANADNVLRGDIARADNYLKTMGLNAETANALRDDFLSVLGLQQQDLARMDARETERITTALNAWLQQFSALTKAGAVSQGSGTGGNTVSVL